MEPSHLALFGSTGRLVTGVFQTLSAGNAGQLVPGSSSPEATGGAVVVVVVAGASVVDVVAKGTVVVVGAVVVVARDDVVEPGCCLSSPGWPTDLSGVPPVVAGSRVFPAWRGGETASEAAEPPHPERIISPARARVERARMIG
jgi:hypothetical protein